MFDKGYVDGEGKVTFRVHVMPCEAHEVERATMSNSFYNDYDSRKETGLIGLKNQRRDVLHELRCCRPSTTFRRFVARCITCRRMRNKRRIHPCPSRYNRSFIVCSTPSMATLPPKT